MTFDSLLLHPEAEKRLAATLKQPGHGLLLSGPAQTGKALIARQLAADLLETDVNKLDNEGVYRQIETADKNISIEQIREAVAFMRLKPLGARKIKRILCIVDADKLTLPAQNAILKLLEEPPAATVILLTSSYPKRLLHTVRSRVHELPLPAPTGDQIRTYLSGQHAADEISQAVLMGGGRVGAVISLLRGEGAAMPLAEVKKTLQLDLFGQLLLVDSKLKNKDEALSFVEILLQIAAATTLKLAETGKPVAHWLIIHRAALAADDALSKNANPKLVMTELMLSLR